MGHWQRWIVGGLGVVLILAALGGQGLVSAADPIYVDVQALGDNNGSSWEHAFTDLESALEVAGPGDQIWVAEGIYRPTETHGGIEDRYKSFQLRNDVAIYGGFDPTVGDTEWEERDWVLHETILSGDLNGDDGPEPANNGENSYHVFYHTQGLALDSSAVLDGFTITGGNADGWPAHQSGGGMYNDRASPAISNCAFVGNQAGTGGAIYNLACSPALTGCTFEDNSAGRGGGMGNNNASPVLTDCTFTGNSAEQDGASMQHGGGVFNADSSPTLTGCSFEANSAAQHGGGMYNIGSEPTLDSCTFSGNSAQQHGGGMHNDDSSPALTGCTFSGNSAGQYGGGIYNLHSVLPTLSACTFVGNSAEFGGGGIFNDSSSPVLANCIFWGNLTEGVGAAMRNNASSPTLTNCTFSGNSAPDRGGGIYNRSSSPVLTNCILWGDTPDEIYDFEDDNAPAVTYSDIQGGYQGEGNIAADPFFVDLGYGALHLGACSPCIDAGDNGAPALPSLDFEGDDRILDGDSSGIATVDMGVDELAVPGICFRTSLPAVFKRY